MKVSFLYLKNLIFRFSNFVIIFTLFISYTYILNYSPNAPTSNNNEYSFFSSQIKNIYNSDEKLAFLTFDDGPSKNITPKVLDILKEEDVKATFFVVGKQVQEYPEITKRAFEEGHYIANHGYSHNNFKLYSNSQSFIDEITKTDIAIGEAIGLPDYCSHLFRFPNGFMASMYKKQKREALPILEKLNYTYLDWNCLNNDSMKKYSSMQLLNNLKKSAKDKSVLVILMHDTSDVSNSSLVLKDSISYLKSQGYTFDNFYRFM